MAELVLAMLILSVLAVTALPRLDGSLALAGSAHRDELIGALRQAHATAMASRRLVCVRVANVQTTAVVASSAAVADCDSMGAAPAGSVTLLFQADGTVARSGGGGGGGAADTITLSVADQPAVIVYAGSGHVE